MHSQGENMKVVFFVFNVLVTLGAVVAMAATAGLAGAVAWRVFRLMVAL